MNERPRDEAFETMCEVCSIDWQAGITSDQRGRVNAALKQLRDIYGDIETLPMMIHERAAAWRVVYPQIPATPQALTGNWASLLDAAAQVRERERASTKEKRKVTNAHARRGCETCGDDHYVTVGEDEDGNELTAPCPDCNAGAKAGFWVQGRRHEPIGPEETRRRMQAELTRPTAGMVEQPAQADTSSISAEQIAHVTGGLRLLVLRVIDATGGCTDEEGMALTDLPPNTYRPRRVELHEGWKDFDGGYVYKSDDRRSTVAGRPAIVWRVTEKGKGALSQESLGE